MKIPNKHILIMITLDGRARLMIKTRRKDCEDAIGGIATPMLTRGSDNRPFACHDFVRVLQHLQPPLTPHKMLTIVSELSDARIKMCTMAPDARMHRGLAVEPFKTAEEFGPGSLKRRSQAEM